MMMDERKFRILQAIIDDYILTAVPVGSRTISKKYDMGLSSATIRNEMSDLEELGYLDQPHVSAGRIPSAKAYRLYVDQLLKTGRIPSDSDAAVKGHFLGRMHQMEDVIDHAAQVLSSLTSYTAVVLPPTGKMPKIRTIQLVPVSDTSALVVIVTDMGIVRDQVVQVASDLDSDALYAISKTLTERLQGLTLHEAVAQMPQLMQGMHENERLLQGLGLGGEWGGAVLMTYEYASKKERAFYASIPQMGLATGLCLSSGVVAFLSMTLTDAQFLEWGWRVAFLMSVFLVGIALWVRLSILETPDFRKVQDQAAKDKTKKALPIVRVCKNHPFNILLGVGARWVDGVFFNVLAVFVITYLVQYIHVDRTSALVVVMIAALLMCPFIAFFGHMADKYGRGKVYGICAVLCGISIFPSFWLMQNSNGNLFMIAIAIIIPLSIFYAGIFLSLIHI